MKTFLLLSLLSPLLARASVVGISTHPFSVEARALSAELTGFMSERHEMGSGLRFTQEVGRHRILDVSAAGAQESRSLTLSAGLDFALLEEKISQPRVSLKPNVQYLKYEGSRHNLIGIAPTIRKGISVNGSEFFPYIAVPAGMRVDGTTGEFDFYASLTVGASMNFPGAGSDKLLLSIEGNKNMGFSSDYIGCLVTWVWR